MEKIGIITIVRGNNYGNVLQNFALQYTLSQLGFISETINCTASNTAHSFRSISRLYLGAALRTAKGKHHQFHTVRRTKAFVRFRESHISYSPFRTCAGQFPAQKVLGYDCFLFGSDQIWNLKFDFVRNERDLFFGAFTKDVPKIAYAASFGTSEIEPEYREFVAEQIKSFQSISVREDAGQKICEQFGVDSQVVPDPTLLLSDEVWRSHERAPKKQKNKYLLTYFLGEISDTIWQEIDEYAKKQNLDIISMNHSQQYCRTKEDLSYFCCGPDEFLWLIDHCSAFVTDSFHGTVFSLIFRKPFQVCKRVANEANNDMSSRLETLLGYFKENQRLNSSHIDPSLLQNPPSAETVFVRSKLMDRGIGFLKTHLKGET